MNQLDVLFINPGNSFGIYQDLSAYYVCIEPPTWAMLLAKSCQSKGFNAAILDANAERLSDEESVKRIESLNPRLICFVLYGQNVNASTVGMSGAVRLSSLIKKSGIKIPISYIGGYVQSLPKKTLLDESSIDIVFTNEGVYALRNLLASDIDLNNLSNIKGIGWRKNREVILNLPEKIVPQELMDIDLPGYAFELLPYKEKPFDLYRSPMWHAQYQQHKRSPYCAIQTSLGCPYGCEFCVINTINKDDNEEIGIAGNYSKIRYWSTEFIIKEFDKLYQYGVRTIKITDELFLLNKNYYKPLCEKLIERGYGKDLNLWCYSRCDSVCSYELLQLLKLAGIKHIALGIESSNKNIRLEVSKGKFEDIHIKNVVKRIESAGIEVMANYMFGLPEESKETMQQTLDLSLELCTAGWNGYATMCLPGSFLYAQALKNNINLPKSYEGYSFHSYDCVCNSTKYLTSAEILRFRDDAYKTYHTNSNFLNKIEKLYGKEAAENIKKMAEVKLKRQICGD